MKRITLYACETCSFSSADALEVEKHEAEHLNLTVDELHEYQDLKREAAHFSSIVSEHNNEQTRVRYDEACEALTDFEVKHGIH